MTSPKRWLAPSLALIVLGLAAAAQARPGGGGGYSSGSRSSSSSSSSSSGSSSYRSSSSSSSSSPWPSSSSSRSSYSGSSSSYSGSSDPLIAFIALAVLVAVAIPLAIAFDRASKDDDFDSSPSPQPRPVYRPLRAYSTIRANDPEFSAVLFEDFLYTLYARVHASRQLKSSMNALAPYVSDGSRDALMRREPSGVHIHSIVVGRMQVEHVRVTDKLRVDVVFESNYTAKLPTGQQGYYSQETWTLERALDVRSRPPNAVLSFHCPACGAPYRRSDAGACDHCGVQVEGGRFDWSVAFVNQRSLTTVPPALTGDAPEQGTGMPTVFDPDLEQQLAGLKRDDPNASPAHLERRLHDIYAVLNNAWTARDLRPIRPHVSDAMFNYLSYWIDAYRNQSLTNVLKEMEISRVQIAKVNRDKHFDAVTLRFWATGIDYTTHVGGRRVGGSPTKKRAYSEYWTLIRGSAVRGAPRDPTTCPSCGAALDRVNQAGNCEYCDAHLTRGEFDWVLSKIEQDESYSG